MRCIYISHIVDGPYWILKRLQVLVKVCLFVQRILLDVLLARTSHLGRKLQLSSTLKLVDFSELVELMIHELYQLC